MNLSKWLKYRWKSDQRAYILKKGHDIKQLREMIDNPNREVEQLQVQLAGCSVAALGHTKDPAKQGDYGWSPAYQDVLDLRKKYDNLLTQKPRDI